MSQFNDVNNIISRFPDRAETLFVDHYLNDTPHCSTRVFRLYKDLPLHHHESCDEMLFLLRGVAQFRIEEEDGSIREEQKMVPGQMVTFHKHTIHGVKIVENPVIFLSCDTPRRSPDDVCFRDLKDTQGVKFVSHLSDYE